MTTPNTLAKLAAELAQLASEGPALIHTQSGAYISQKLSEAAKALAAQALPAAEPVAWAVAGEVTNWARDFSKYRTQHYVRPVYTAPQATQQAAQAHCGKCDECGKDQADGWALYCVGCLEKTGLLAKEALPNAQHVSSTAADLTGPNDTAAQATTGAAATGGGVTTGAPSEPFGYFKAQPFGWTDCVETDDGAIALYERPNAGGQLEQVAKLHGTRKVLWDLLGECLPLLKVDAEFSTDYEGKEAIELLIEQIEAARSHVQSDELPGKIEL